MPICPNWQTATLLQAEETSVTSAHTGRTYRIQAAVLGERPAGGYPCCIFLTGMPFFPPSLIWRNPAHQPHHQKPCRLSDCRHRLHRRHHPRLKPTRLDYTPPLPDSARIERKQYGQADRFSRFIDDELSALLDSKYRINTQNQAVFGHSFGALYGLYSCSPAPNASAIICWFPRPSGGKIAAYSIGCPTLCRKGVGIRLSAGEHEGRNNRPDQTSRGMVAQAKILAGTLHHLGADVRFTPHPNANHGNAPFYALTDSIEYLRSAWQR